MVFIFYLILFNKTHQKENRRVKRIKTKQEGKKVGEERERKDIKKGGGRSRGKDGEKEGHLQEV